MGNQSLVAALQRTNHISIVERGVGFFEDRFVAESIFQRHNFQMYKVRDTQSLNQNNQNSLNQLNKSYFLRIINSLNDEESIAIIEHMQTTLIQISHPNLVQYYAIAVEQEQPQIKFLILEEDLGESAISLKTLIDAVAAPGNHLLAQYFSDNLLVYRAILQSLRAIAHLNENGKTFGELHGDISPMSIVIQMNEQTVKLGSNAPDQTQFRLKILDYLKIRDLVEIAQRQTDLQTTLQTGDSVHMSPNSRRNLLQKPLSYDAPERLFVNQKDIGLQADMWSLGVSILEFSMACQGANLEVLQNLREMPWESRLNLLKEQICDGVLLELLKQMLQEQDKRPTAGEFLASPLIMLIETLVDPQMEPSPSPIFAESIQNEPSLTLSVLVSALQFSDKNKAIVAFFTLMRLSEEIGDFERSKTAQMLLEEVLRQKAYRSIIELLVICMKEYSSSQANSLSPQEPDQFKKFYSQAFMILNRILEMIQLPDRYKGKGTSDDRVVRVYTARQLKHEIQLAGGLSLAILITESLKVSFVNIESRNDQQQLLDQSQIDNAAENERFLQESLALLSNFVENSSSTLLKTCENLGLIQILIQYFEKRDSLQKASRESIQNFLQKVLPILTTKSLQNISKLTLESPKATQNICIALQNYGKDTIFKHFISKSVSKILQNQSKTTLQSVSSDFDTQVIINFVAQLIYLCGLQKNVTLASTFQICVNQSQLVKSLKQLPQSSSSMQQFSFSYPLGFTCLTCSQLLQSLTSNQIDGSKMEVCFSCATRCHSQHQLESLGPQSHFECKCEAINGFQVADKFHQCQAKEKQSQPQILFDQTKIVKIQSQGHTQFKKGNNVEKIQIRDKKEIEGESSLLIFSCNSFEINSVMSTDAICVQDEHLVSKKPTPNKIQTSDNSQIGISTLNTIPSPVKITEKGPLVSRKDTAQIYGEKINSNAVKDEKVENVARINMDLSRLTKYDTEKTPEKATIAAYFETKVILGGLFDQIAIGLTTNADFPLHQTMIGYTQDSIGFHIDDGRCFVRGESFGYGPAVGSGSTIGCGITTTGDVFFTVDSIQLSIIKARVAWRNQSPKVPPPNSKLHIYPVVSMRGKLSTIKLNFGHEKLFMYKSVSYNPELDNFLENLCLDKDLLNFVAFEIGSKEIVNKLKQSVSSVRPVYEIFQKTTVDFLERLIEILDSQKVERRRSVGSRGLTKTYSRDLSNENSRQRRTTNQLLNSQSSRSLRQIPTLNKTQSKGSLSRIQTNSQASIRNKNQTLKHHMSQSKIEQRRTVNSSLGLTTNQQVKQRVQNKNSRTYLGSFGSTNYRSVQDQQNLSQLKTGNQTTKAVSRPKHKLVYGKTSERQATKNLFNQNQMVLDTNKILSRAITGGQSQTSLQDLNQNSIQLKNVDKASRQKEILAQITGNRLDKNFRYSGDKNEQSQNKSQNFQKPPTLSIEQDKLNYPLRDENASSSAYQLVGQSFQLPKQIRQENQNPNTQTCTNPEHSETNAKLTYSLKSLIGSEKIDSAAIISHPQNVHATNYLQPYHNSSKQSSSQQGIVEYQQQYTSDQEGRKPSSFLLASSQNNDKSVAKNSDQSTHKDYLASNNTSTQQQALIKKTTQTMSASNLRPKASQFDFYQSGSVVQEQSSNHNQATPLTLNNQNKSDFYAKSMKHLQTQGVENSWATGANTSDTDSKSNCIIQ